MYLFSLNRLNVVWLCIECYLKLVFGVLFIHIWLVVTDGICSILTASCRLLKMYLELIATDIHIVYGFIYIDY